MLVIYVIVRWYEQKHKQLMILLLLLMSSLMSGRFICCGSFVDLYTILVLNLRLYRSYCNLGSVGFACVRTICGALPEADF